MIVKRRPAETASVASLAVAYLIARALGSEDDSTLIWALATVVAIVPALVTGIVELARK